MKNFTKIELPIIKTIIDTINDELLINEDLWLVNQHRQKTKQLFQHTQNIELYVADKSGYQSGVRTETVMECKLSNIAHMFPNTLVAFTELIETLAGTIVRAKIARISPREKIYPHIDSSTKNDFFHFCDRYHLVLQSKNGSPLYSDNESVIMQENELWWFDNQKMHWAENPSDDWRVHLVFDIKPNSGICRRDIDSL